MTVSFDQFDRVKEAQHANDLRRRKERRGEGEEREGREESCGGDMIGYGRREEEGEDGERVNDAACQGAEGQMA